MASANVDSLMEIAKANHGEPYQQLSWMNLLPTTPVESIVDLMPWNLPDLSDGKLG